MKTSLVLICVLVLALQAIDAGKKSGNGKGRKCGSQRCRAGQKCTERADGEQVCTCRQFCPQKRFLVCGSDGRTYFNKCELHRIACVEKRKLKITSDGACPSNNDVPAAEVKEKKSTTQKLPLVCYQIERDELRQLLVDGTKRRSVKENKTYQDTVKEMFQECDQDRTNVLDADELLRCTEKDGQNIKDTDAHILRGLCVDALIGIASTKKNWVLTELELQHLLEPNFVPPPKKCQLEDRKYKDGTETKVDCNVCVCACGDWVCTGAPCGKEASKNPGIPGPVTRGRLPSVNQRETFLNGFKAAAEVNIPAVQDQVATKQHSRDIASQLDELNTKH